MDRSFAKDIVKSLPSTAKKSCLKRQQCTHCRQQETDAGIIVQILKLEFRSMNMNPDLKKKVRLIHLGEK